MFYPYEEVYLKDKKETGEHVILNAYEYLDKENEYQITDFFPHTYKESELTHVPNCHRAYVKRFKNELALGEYVLSNVNHKRTFGRIIGRKYCYRTSRIQYILDNGYFFFSSQLRVAKRGI